MILDERKVVEYFVAMLKTIKTTVNSEIKPMNDGTSPGIITTSPLTSFSSSSTLSKSSKSSITSLLSMSSTGLLTLLTNTPLNKYQQYCVSIVTAAIVKLIKDPGCRVAISATGPVASDNGVHEHAAPIRNHINSHINHKQDEAPDTLDREQLTQPPAAMPPPECPNRQCQGQQAPRQSATKDSAMANILSEWHRIMAETKPNSDSLIEQQPSSVSDKGKLFGSCNGQHSNIAQTHKDIINGDHRNIRRLNNGYCLSGASIPVACNGCNQIGIRNSRISARTTNRWTLHFSLWLLFSLLVTVQAGPAPAATQPQQKRGKYRSI